MGYKAVALDLDGTLLDGRKGVSQRNRDVIRTLQERGVKIILASGRPDYGMLGASKALHLRQYGGATLSFNGAVVTDCGSGKVIYRQLLDSRFPRILYAYAREADMAIASYEGPFVISEQCDDPWIRHEMALNKMVARPVDNFILSIPYEVPKCLITGDPEPLYRLELKLKEELAGEASVSRSEPFFLEIMAEGIDKGASLGRLLSCWGIAREELVAFGDGFNDLTMLRYAGLGVAMGNAQPEVKAEAGMVAPTNDEDGVAQVLEQLF